MLRPRSVAVVGATDRPGSYGDATLRNLEALGFPGAVWGVHRPARRCSAGRACRRSTTCPSRSTPSSWRSRPPACRRSCARRAGAAAAASSCSPAGFAEAGAGALQAELRRRGRGAALPVIGPNCDGLVAFHSRAALWGDALAPRPAGRVALVSQSGNVAVNAIALGRGLRFHTVASVGNQAVVDAAALLEELAGESVGSVALFLESDGDGARLTRALALAAERGVGVAVLKVGATAAGATAAAAHTGSLAGDQRVFRALVEEAGAAWADDVHDLLELAKALAVPGARVRPRAGRARARDPHLLRRRLGARRGRGGPARPAAPAAGGDDCGAAGGAAARGRDGRQPARLHGDDLGRARARRGDRPRGRRGPGDRPAAALLRRAGRDARRAAREWDAVREGLADGAVGGGVAGAAGLHAARAAPGPLGVRAARPRDRAGGRAADRAGLRRGAAHAAGRPGAAAGDRGGGGAGRAGRLDRGGRREGAAARRRRPRAGGPRGRGRRRTRWPRRASSAARSR